MKILIVGNGAREHALAWKAAQSPMVKIVFVAPGNAGTASELKLQNIAINATNIPLLLEFAKAKNIDLTIVGPEMPLVLGIVDIFRNAGLRIFGPTKAASQLEGSKTFAKEFFIRHHIPTGIYKSFTDLDAALNYLSTQSIPIVIKADGIASGKGVIVAKTRKEAEVAIYNLLINHIVEHHQESINRIIIEEYLDGEEASFIVIVDGENVLPLATSQDHKQVGNGDTGPNTGGMGAYSPATVINNAVHQRIMNQIILPTVKGMKEEGNIYTGILYAGVIIDKVGQPKVIEFNCRFGDPEAQTLMMRLRSDLITLCLFALRKQLNKQIIQWDARTSISVVLATKGYPGKYAIGSEIHGVPLFESNDKKIFHAGTIITDNNILVTNGGRVLCITTLGKDIAEARKNAYDLAKSIFWEDMFYRTDIGHRAMKIIN
ncbi:phosphoribosylamine--glycine ligase [Pantoea sp. Mhis]|uniref:phosphoribosylamine--glycine ligase n=1 Tax=Pantoea sp. Mhis TaxID=2576759 RepID=UPI00135A1E4F|nr:phosphoribosylamine--glycine ligase [Pantoea sp. Mhis]MXP56522.1 phosphoribosylamine--glycine ligase [Pantoea sp. Mhis]